jgi:hypothetical protein
MQKCISCKFWGIDPGSGEETGEESQMPFRRCGKGGSNDGKPIVASTLACAVDGYDHAAWLLTSPDFGCVMHEPK